MNKTPTNYQPIATWFRYCLLLTAIFNLSGAIGFSPPVFYQNADDIVMPKDVTPFALWVIALWILIFGMCYAWLAIIAKPEKFFIAVATVCKIAIASLIFIFCFRGNLPLTFLFGGVGDLFFALTFMFWLWQTQSKVK